VNAPRPVTVLCVASFFKGEEFLRECKRLGCRVLLLTVEKLRERTGRARRSTRSTTCPTSTGRDDVFHGVSYLARSEEIARIVPLDEYDLEMASALREHLRVPGMGETTVRYFRDKLAMRMRAEEAGIRVPEFAPVINYDRLRDYMARVPAPLGAEAAHRRLRDGHPQDPRLRAALARAGRAGRQAVVLRAGALRTGKVFHVDSVVWKREVVFAEANGYFDPPFDVYHGGGLFSTRTLDRGSAEAEELRAMNSVVAQTFGIVRGVLHTEFIRGHHDGKLYFLETAARVGGANIVEMVEAATGVNLWREWARVEVADARGQEYTVPARAATTAACW
jgi:hypothetical protein